MLRWITYYIFCTFVGFWVSSATAWSIGDWQFWLITLSADSLFAYLCFCNVPKSATPSRGE